MLQDEIESEDEDEAMTHASQQHLNLMLIFMPAWEWEGLQIFQIMPKYHNYNRG